jgi:hypothetical protein
MDRRGPRLVIEIGAGLTGSGLLLAAFAREPWQLYLTLGALVGGGVNCLAYTGQSLYLPHWFVRQRGLALSIAFSGVVVGSIALLPWVQSMIANAGWRRACWAHGTDAGARRPAVRSVRLMTRQVACNPQQRETPMPGIAEFLADSSDKLIIAEPPDGNCSQARDVYRGAALTILPSPEQASKPGGPMMPRARTKS